MAESVDFRVEATIAELEEMEKSQLFEPNEIRTIAKNRKDLEYKIHRQTKDKESFMAYVQYETNVLKMIHTRRHAKQKKKSGTNQLEYSIANRINQLYEIAIHRFNEDIRMWLAYVTFCNQFHFKSRTSRILDQLIEQHSDKQEVFKMAADWEYQENKDFERARTILFAGIHIHKRSPLLYTEALRLEFNFAQAKRKESEGIDGVIDVEDPILQGQNVTVLYDSAFHIAQEASFIVNLLELCNDYAFTEDLQRKMVSDLKTKFSNDEVTWHTIAQRILKGLPVDAGDGQSKNSLMKRIERCDGVYREAVDKLKTERIWMLYLDTLLLLMEDKEKLPVFKSKALKRALEAGHKAGMLTEKHYLYWIELLAGSDKNVQLAGVLQKATATLDHSMALWHRRLGFHLAREEVSMARAVFTDGCAKLGNRALPLWQLMIQYNLYGNSAEVEALYERGIMEPGAEISGPLKAQYIEWLAVSRNMNASRRLYARLCQQPPFCLEMHNKMARLEEMQPTLVVKNARRCHFFACKQFGAKNTDVWIASIKFEQRFGEPQNVPQIHKTAVAMLAPGMVDLFMSEFSLMKATPRPSDTC